MKTPIIPNYVKIPLSLLEKEGFECFIVGGCVRDSLMGKLPSDFDLTTSATPDEMLSVFRDFKVIKTGLQHGTLTVVSDGNNLEITTYRTDGEYEDNRHPSSVAFSKNIADDLSRRDFTVNTLAYSDKRGLIDLFGGVDDIKNATIRSVGNPDIRFREDGLRIMRALRFAATLGFSIEKTTSDSIHNNRNLLKNIAVERIFTEFCKLICGADAPKILAEYSDVVGVFIPEMLECVGFDQRSPHHSLDIYAHTCLTLDGCDKDDTVLRLAAFLHDVGKPQSFVLDGKVGHFPNHAKLGAELTDTVLRRLRADNATREAVVRLVLEHCKQIEPCEKSVKRFLATHTENETRRWLALCRADRLACAPHNRSTENYDRIEELIEQIKRSDACLSLKTLKINGNDLLSLGYEGREIGKILNFLLAEVMDGKLPNDRAALLDSAKKINLPQK